MGKNAIDVAVGAQIESRRLTLRLSLEQLAESLSLPPERLAAIESGEESASVYVLYSVSKLLDVPVSYFFELTKTKDGPKNS